MFCFLEWFIKVFNRWRKARKENSLLQNAVGTSSLYGLLEELDKFMKKIFVWAVTPKDTTSGAGNPWPVEADERTLGKQHCLPALLLVLHAFLQAIAGRSQWTCTLTGHGCSYKMLKANSGTYKGNLQIFLCCNLLYKNMTILLLVGRNGWGQPLALCQGPEGIPHPFWGFGCLGSGPVWCPLGERWEDSVWSLPMPCSSRVWF